MDNQQKNQDRRMSSRPHNPPVYFTYGQLGNPAMPSMPSIQHSSSMRSAEPARPLSPTGSWSELGAAALPFGTSSASPHYSASAKSVSNRSRATSYLSSVTKKTVIEAKAQKEIAELTGDTEKKILELESESEIDEFEIQKKQKVVDQIQNKQSLSDEDKDVLKCRQAEIDELEKNVFRRNVEIKKLKKQLEINTKTISVQVESDKTLAECEDDDNESQNLGSDEEDDKATYHSGKENPSPTPSDADKYAKLDAKKTQGNYVSNNIPESAVGFSFFPSNAENSEVPPLSTSSFNIENFSSNAERPQSAGVMPTGAEKHNNFGTSPHIFGSTHQQNYASFGIMPNNSASLLHQSTLNPAAPAYIENVDFGTMPQKPISSKTAVYTRAGNVNRHQQHIPKDAAMRQPSAFQKEHHRNFPHQSEMPNRHPASSCYVPEFRRPEAPHQSRSELGTSQQQVQDPIRELASAIKDLAVNRVPTGSRADKELPEFDGRSEHFAVFFSEYERTTEEFQINNSENLRRLTRALKGRAKDLVFHLFVNPNNVPKIIDLLKETFGRADLVLNTLIEKAKGLKPLDDRHESLALFGTAVDAILTNIESYGMTDYLFDCTLVSELVRKLPRHLQSQWTEWILEDPRRKSNIKFFSEWLQPKVRAARYMSVEVLSPPPTRIKEMPKSKTRSRHVGTAAEKVTKKKTQCENCKIPGHTLQECRKFRKRPTEERRKLVDENNLCFRCLGSGHIAKKCRTKSKCQVEGCGSTHNTLLHLESESSNAEKSGTKPDAENKENAESITKDEQEPKSNFNGYLKSSNPKILKYVPVRVFGPNGAKEVYAFLDEGSHVNMIHSELAEELGIRGPEVNLNVCDWEGAEKNRKTMIVEFGISGIAQNAKQFRIRDARVLPMDCAEQTYDYNEIINRHPELAAAPIQSQINAKPQVLIGTQYWRLGYPRAKIEPTPNSEAAIKTWLGWILVGAEDSGRQQGCYNVSIKDEELTNLVRQYLCLDSFGTAVDTPIRSKEDQKSLAILESTTRKIGEDRWETGLLWRDAEPEMPNSKVMALKRLRHMENKADRDPEFAALYISRFEEYISKGYLVESALDAEPEMPNRKWYLPHFFAYNPNKKPRLVFDAAAKCQGRSFNDYLMKGPDFLQQLPGVLIRFRRHKVAITGDIKEMFHQVRLRKEDWPSQTILYRGMDRKSPPKEYQMRVLFFGSACSPCSAIYVRDRNAAEYENLYPDAVRAIHRDNYMDDFHSGAETDAEALEIFRQVEKINRKGGFPILKWSSSSPAVLASIPSELRAAGDKEIKVKSDIPQEKTLGMIWRPSEDVFGFKVNLSRLPTEVLSASRRPTKREMASFIMSLFDPLGILTPLKIKGLAIFQETWKVGIGWDDEVPESTADQFRFWIEELHQIDSLAIPRCFAPNKNADSRLELHVFCDASTEAYAAAAYIRAETGGRVELSLLFGKARVKPLKSLTVPRMELQAALLGVRISEFVQKAFDADLSFQRIIYWSDSRTVLCWINSETGRFSQYVNNRIQEILMKSNPTDWRWVPTADNIADDATRPSKSVKLDNKSRWITGHGFLQKPESAWPKVPDNAEDLNPSEEDLELKVCVNATTEKRCRLPLPDETRFSNWWTLIWKTASWVRSVRVLTQTPKTKNAERLINLDDVKYAELLWAKQVQSESFSADIRDLTEGRKLRATSRLLRLQPILDNGLLVIKGRLQNADAEKYVKHPIILDPKHRYSELLIQWHHEVFGHQGQESVLAAIRQKYWILDARSAVRKVISKCIKCRIQNAKSPSPTMGQLPECRTAVGKPPFTNTGVDLFGPIEVAIGRRHEKRWGVIFTCMTTRASHLDLVPTLSTSDFIDCLVRFNARRGPAEHLFSDNGTNFRGADAELCKAVSALNQNAIRGKLLQQGTEWHFNPPSAPHMGGAWERIIGITKRILKTILKEATPKEYTLLTLLAEIENMLNSRPLTAVSPDPRDPNPLTPNHLLKMRCVTTGIAAGPFDHGEFRRSWRHAQKLADDFWKRFQAEYLPTLNSHKRWYRNGEDPSPIREGDVVIVAEDNAPRNEWRKAIIAECIRGRDGVCRVVRLQMPKNNGGHRELLRPIVKIHPLGVNINEHSASDADTKNED